MLLNFDLAQIAEDYVSEFCDLSGQALKMKTRREHRQTNIFRNTGK